MLFHKRKFINEETTSLRRQKCVVNARNVNLVECLPSLKAAKLAFFWKWHEAVFRAQTGKPFFS